MKKSEKIIAFCFTTSFLLVIFSSIYTFYQLKPQGYCFKIEKIKDRVLKP